MQVCVGLSHLLQACHPTKWVENLQLTQTPILSRYARCLAEDITPARPQDPAMVWIIKDSLHRKVIDESWSFADCHVSQCQRHREQHWNILKFNQNHAPFVHLQFYKYYPNLVPQFPKRMPFVCKASVYLPNQALALQHLQHLRQHHSLRAVRTLLPECYVAPRMAEWRKVLRPKGFTCKSGPRHPTWSPQKMVVLGMTVGNKQYLLTFSDLVFECREFKPTNIFWVRKMEELCSTLHVCFFEGWQNTSPDLMQSQ